MKKQHNHLLIYLFALTLLCLCPTISHAQNNNLETINDSSAIKIANRLSISQNGAKQIQSAYNYRNTEISRLMKDSVANGIQQMQGLKQLVAERNQQLKILVSSSDRARLKGNDSLYTQVLSGIKRRHALQLSRTPHRQLSSTSSSANQ
jgi:hypothetical protein